MKEDLNDKHTKEDAGDEKMGKIALLIIGLAALVAGLVLIGNSPAYGQSLAEEYLATVVSMNGDRFISKIESYTASVRSIGLVVALLGGADVLLTVFFYPKTDTKG